jgi:hypothetical protein
MFGFFFANLTVLLAFFSKSERVSIKLLERWFEQMLFIQSSIGFFTKLLKCGLDYILILMNYDGSL